MNTRERNEALDCFCAALVALETLRVDLDKLEPEIVQERKEPPSGRHYGAMPGGVPNELCVYINQTPVQVSEPGLAPPPQKASRWGVERGCPSVWQRLD